MQESKRLRIGYALEPKRLQTFTTQHFLNHAKDQGIDLIQIDTSKSLIEQGPFHAILHKLYSPEWKTQLIKFSAQNSDIVLIDSPDAIERLHDRISMLEIVRELDRETLIRIPNQVVVHDSKLLSNLNNFKGLEYPVIAKPLVANGSVHSHKLSLVYNNNGLKELEPPIVLQEFVNHGGVIFKVYVMGKYVKCVKRHSLPDISTEKLGTLGNSMTFFKISNTNADSEYKSEVIEKMEMPPLDFVNEIASGLREALGINLFNFDMIRDVKDENRYLIVDINYFPAYEKLPLYEFVVTDFFREIVHEHQSKFDGKDNNEVGSHYGGLSS